MTGCVLGTGTVVALAAGDPRTGLDRGHPLLRRCSCPTRSTSRSRPTRPLLPDEVVQPGFEPLGLKQSFGPPMSKSLRVTCSGSVSRLPIARKGEVPLSNPRSSVAAKGCLTRRRHRLSRLSRLQVARMVVIGSAVAAATAFRVGASCLELLVERTPPLMRLAVEASGWTRRRGQGPGGVSRRAGCRGARVRGGLVARAATWGRRL